MKKIILLLSFVILPSCSFFGNEKIEERIIEQVAENTSMTWIIINEVSHANWIFKFKQIWTENEFTIYSKVFDLSHYINEAVFLNWIKEWENIEVLDINKKEKAEKAEEEKLPYIFSNESWWYKFMIDESRYHAIRWWKKTNIKNWSGELILQISVFPDQRIDKWRPIISDNSNLITLNWAKWEKKDHNYWFDLWLENTWYNELIRLNAKYHQDKEKNKKIILDILDSFKVIMQKKELILCWWKENTLCPTWYICELYWSQDDSSWKCIPIQ